PEFRYSVFAPTQSGVITVAVRLSGPAEGPRATAKLIRWSKLSISELGVEASGGHRIVAVQVEGQVLKGMDEEADRICEFVRGLIAGIDGRAAQAIPIALIQAAPHKAGAARPSAVSRVAGAATGLKRKPLPKAPSKSPAPAKSQAPAKPKAQTGNRLHAVPSSRDKTSEPVARRAAGSRAGKPAHPAVNSSMAMIPALPAPAAPPAAPKPIGVRTAARRPGSHPDEEVADAPSQADEDAIVRRPAQPEPDRSEWIGPHPIEEAPSHQPSRPRPWTP
ncbi:MAG: hypothetical protein ACXWN4_03045, partial [Candidatus Limnocylindrales bacterium]